MQRANEWTSSAEQGTSLDYQGIPINGAENAPSPDLPPLLNSSIIGVACSVASAKRIQHYQGDAAEANGVFRVLSPVSRSPPLIRAAKDPLSVPAARQRLVQDLNAQLDAALLFCYKVQYRRLSVHERAHVH